MELVSMLKYATCHFLIHSYYYKGMLLYIFYFFYRAFLFKSTHVTTWMHTGYIKKSLQTEVKTSLGITHPNSSSDLCKACYKQYVISCS